MECIKQGTLVVTIAIVTHGVVISTALTQEQYQLFDGARLFTMSGKFDNVVCHDMVRDDYFRKLYTIFRENLDQSTYKKVNAYKEMLTPKYMSYLRMFFDDLENKEVCQIYPHIDFDKAYLSDSSMTGIYLVSVHLKHKNTLELIYPAVGMNDDIRLDSLRGICEFNTKFNMNIDCTPLVERIQKLSSPYPKGVDATSRQLDAWNVSVTTSGTITHIRLSYLVYLVKCILTGQCSSSGPVAADSFSEDIKLNLFDFSCSSLHKSIQGNPITNYTDASVESGIEKFGGA